MAKYGTSRYGSGFRYGETSAVGVYYNSGIEAWSYNYNEIAVSWGVIIPDPNDGALTHWKLVRSTVGNVDDPNNGTYLAGGLYSTITSGYTDIVASNFNGEHCYSLWVFTGTKWISCGAAYALNVSDESSLQRVSNWLPKAWLNVTDYTTGEAVGENENNTFYKVLEVFSFVYDKLRLEAFLLGNVNNRIYTPNSILKYKISDFNFPFEPALGDTYHRSLSSVGNLVHSHKGTATAFATFTTALTHWGNDVRVGHNLLLDYNDASFEESLGRWSASNGTLAQKTFDAESLSPPSLSQTLWELTTLPKLSGFGQLTTASTSAVTLSLPGNGNNVTLYGIPVKPNTNYFFRGSVLHRDNAATVTSTIEFYDMYGTLLAATSGGPSLTTTTSWKEITATDSSGIMSHPKAKFARVKIIITPSSASSSRYAIDLCQFTELENIFIYQDPRRVNIHVHGEKQNFMPNGSFENGIHGWEPFNGSAIEDSTKTAAIVLGSKCLKLKSTANGNSAIVSDWIPVDPSTAYTASAYVLGSAARKARIRIEFSSKATLEEQAQVLTDANGTYYAPLVNYSDSDEITLSTTTKNQISVSFLSPPVSQDSVAPCAKVSIYFSDNLANDEYWIDGAMLEEGSETSPYFNGFSGVVPANPVVQQYYSPNDCKWETKNRFNYMHNHGFETNTTDWTSTGTLTRTASDSGLDPLYNSYFGKVAFTTSTTITGTYYLKQAAKGGEDIVVSAYVRRPSSTAITYGIGNSVYTLPASGDGWTRISGVYKLTSGATTGTFTISVSGTTATYVHIDGVQVEYGRIPSQYILFNDAGTTTLVNPTNSAKNILATQSEAQNSGKSTYFHNYDIKISRLRASLGDYAMHGSSWAIKTGLPTHPYTDIEKSLIPNNSFETSLGNWVTSNSTLSRNVSSGSIFDYNTVSGQAYAVVTTAGSSGNKTYGIVSGAIPITANGGYYASAAVRPAPSVSAAGDYILTVDFYDANNYSTGSGFGTPLYTKTKTIGVTLTTRWAYIADTYPVGNITGAAYARITIKSTPTTYSASNAFHVDNVVFRQ
jgi:hypothetical protein